MVIVEEDLAGVAPAVRLRGSGTQARKQTAIAAGLLILANIAVLLATDVRFLGSYVWLGDAVAIVGVVCLAARGARVGVFVDDSTVRITSWLGTETLDKARVRRFEVTEYLGWVNSWGTDGTSKYWTMISVWLQDSPEIPYFSSTAARSATSLREVRGLNLNLRDGSQSINAFFNDPPNSDTTAKHRAVKK